MEPRGLVTVKVRIQQPCGTHILFYLHLFNKHISTDRFRTIKMEAVSFSETSQYLSRYVVQHP